MSSTQQTRRQAKLSKGTASRKKPTTARSARSIDQRLSPERAIVGGTILLTLAIVGVVLWSQVRDWSQSVPDQGRTHVGQDTPHPAYLSNPPTSGWHDAQSAPWGMYRSVIPDEVVVHNLEHGGIWLSYRDADDAESVQQLQAMVSRYPTDVIVTYRPSNDSRIAVAAWTRLLKLEWVDSRQIDYFITQYRNKAPENPPQTR